jgi:hypothetical protein
MGKYIRITFTKPTEVKFIDPDTGRRMWYASHYGRGTHIDVLDFLSGNGLEIHVKCLDGETAVLETQAVQIEQNLVD